MTASVLNNDHDQALDLSVDSPKKIEWVVKDNPQLQAELNVPWEGKKKLSPKVVNKVLDRIKDL